MTSIVLFKKIFPKAVIPTYGSDEAAGLDLYAIEPVLVVAGKQTVVGTGIAFKPPPGTYGRIAPRSGLAHRHGVQILGGVIDRDYRGEIKAMLLATETFQVNAGDRIAQLILELYVRAEGWEVDELDDTQRGAGGFGSTGVL